MIVFILFMSRYLAVGSSVINRIGFLH